MVHLTSEGFKTTLWESSWCSMVIDIQTSSSSLLAIVVVVAQTNIVSVEYQVVLDIELFLTCLPPHMHAHSSTA